jgi:predicted nucleic acid-binding protein
LYGKITVTESVRGEACHPSAPEKLRGLFGAVPEWVSVVPDQTPFLEETSVLDPGEASAITLAWQNRETSLLILDERRGRKVADALGLRMTGTAGLLADAAVAGLIDFDEVFLRLSQTGFRLSTQVVDELRRKLQKHPGTS